MSHINIHGYFCKIGVKCIYTVLTGISRRHMYESYCSIRNVFFAHSHWEIHAVAQLLGMQMTRVNFYIQNSMDFLTIFQAWDKLFTTFICTGN